MKRRFIIQKLVALVLVLLFCSSMVPRQTWHDAMVSHQKPAGTDEPSDVPHVKAHKFNCTGHQPDVQCPYVSSSIFVSTIALPYAPLLAVLYKNDTRQIFLFAYALRGPPTFIA